MPGEDYKFLTDDANADLVPEFWLSGTRTRSCRTCGQTKAAADQVASKASLQQLEANVLRKVNREEVPTAATPFVMEGPMQGSSTLDCLSAGRAPTLVPGHLEVLGVHLDPTLVLVYSLGDEMYKRCHAGAIRQPFRSKLDEMRPSRIRLGRGSTAETPVFSTWWLKAW